MSEQTMIDRVTSILPPGSTVTRLPEEDTETTFRVGINIPKSTLAEERAVIAEKLAELEKT